DVGAERSLLGDPADDLMILGSDHHRPGREGGADVPVLAVGGEDLHARSAGDDDPGLLLVGVTIQDGDIVLAPHRDPYLGAVRGEERLVRRATDVRDVLYGVGRSLDECHGIRSKPRPWCGDLARTPGHAPAPARGTGG